MMDYVIVKKKYKLQDGRTAVIEFENGVGAITEKSFDMIMNEWIPVVRCMNCVHHREDGFCEVLRSYCGNDEWFCAPGKRMGNGLGERMSEYEKLVESLRSYSTEVISYKIDGAFAYAVTAAADVIEQLGKDNAVLTKERDAAIADLKQASKIPFGGCHLCTSIRTEICKECYRSDMFAEIAKNPTDHWEWRGVQEEENGTEI